MASKLTRSGLGVLCLTTLGVGGCAFELGDSAIDAPGTCESDGDCLSFESCDLTTNLCKISVSPPSDFVLEGGFDCVFDEVQLGGAGLSVGWPEFEDNNFVVPEGNAVLSQICILGPTSEDLVGFNIEGSIRFDPTFGNLGFYRAQIVIPRSLVKPGEQDVAATLGLVMFCPPTGSDPTSRPTTLECLNLFELEPGVMAFDNGNLTPGVGLVSGHLEFPLAPAVDPPIAE